MRPVVSKFGRTVDLHVEMTQDTNARDSTALVQSRAWVSAFFKAPQMTLRDRHVREPLPKMQKGAFPAWRRQGQM